MPQSLDASAVRTWCRLALRELGRAREEIDAINVYPVADADTGTNLYLTVESAAQSVDAVFDGHAASGARPDRAEAVRAMAHGALIGARGNSGTILAQLLRGMGEVLAAKPDETTAAEGPGHEADAAALRDALRRAAASAYQAVAHPVEGTMLSVAVAAAEAAAFAAGTTDAIARAAYDGARRALAATPGQLDVLGRAGVVDAGGLGLVAVLGALADAIDGEGRAVPRPEALAGAAAVPRMCVGDGAPDPHAVPGGPAYEVIYLLEAPDPAIPVLRDRLDALGDSLVVVGGDGLWNVHVHVDDAGAAVEAGVEAGRPYRIRITHFGDAARDAASRSRRHGRRPEPVRRAVVSVVRGEGLADLCTQAGATVVRVCPDAPIASGDIAEAVRRANALEVVLLPNDAELRDAAAAAAEQARAEGVRVAVIPTRSPVQGIAALAVHEPTRRFDEDVVAMTSAAGATRYAELAVAERESWTMAGVCQAGDVLGLIDGDVAVIGGTIVEAGTVVLDRMLAAGGEMVTLVLGEGVPDDLAERLQAHVRDSHLAVDTVVYGGGQAACPLIIGVE
ncbi:DAK2 domain-containing protein [Streptomyces sp. RB6PN25]|uniref:DAK2 domain-containing protein n=1 Tax=Streptomyces humicola TaxID=2953240 RepID=A0ABT1Q5X5_9ACTN|nr:DAK2 domain-containing protein [Streptomyces humicola]MCQ4084215.1 DAK2 domain-containing protein [Streptomyces humicola]